MTPAHNHQRTGGILLHPTSLPGPHGIGSLGPDARRFAGVIEAMGGSSTEAGIIVVGTDAVPEAIEGVRSGKLDGTLMYELISPPLGIVNGIPEAG